MPPQLKSMMERWAKQIERISGGSVHSSWNAKASTRAGEGVLLETANWGQGYPYNAYCPVIEGEQAPAGCVATAMAIAMKYHNWPDKTRGGVEYDYYHPSEKFDFDTYTIDWDILSDMQNPGFAEQAAKLTYSAGVAAQMSYGAYESSAATWTLGHLLQYFYAFDKDCQVIPREKFTTEQWDNILKQQLKEVGPVVYFDGAMNHSFVVDGYNSEGLYHVNWGWDGLDNGYFSFEIDENDDISLSSQGMVINLKPDKDKKLYSRAWIPNCEVFIGKEVNNWNFLNPNIEEGQTNTFKAPTICISTFIGYIGLAIVNENDEIIKLVENSAIGIDGYRHYCAFPGAPLFNYVNIELPKLNEGERYQLVSQEQSHLYEEGTNNESMYPPTNKPEDWVILLGGINHPSYFYDKDNNSEIAEVRIHISEDLPSYSGTFNSYDKQFTITGLKGMDCPVVFHFPPNGFSLEATSKDKEGNIIEPLYVYWDSEDDPSFMGYNISLYADEFDLYFNKEEDGNTRRDKGLSSEEIIEKDGLVYQIKDGYLELIGYDNIEENVCIPESLLVGEKEMPIRSLSDKCLAYSPIKSLRIESKNLAIGKFAFVGTKDLKTVFVKDLTLLSDSYDGFGFVDSGLKTLCLEAAPEDNNLFTYFTGIKQEYFYQEDRTSVACAVKDLDIIVVNTPTVGSEYKYILGIRIFYDSSPIEDLSTVFHSYMIPGLGNDDLRGEMEYIPLNISQMWKYGIDKTHGIVSITEPMSNLTIDNVIINGREVTKENDGIYQIDNLSDGKIDVVVEYTVDGDKKMSTHYSTEYNAELPSQNLASVIAVESIQLTPDNWSGIEGESFKIEATVLPEDATDKTLTWSSSDESVATVDGEGTVSVLKEGMCMITAAAADGSGATAECIITSVSGVDSVFSSEEELDVYNLNGSLIKKGASGENLKQLTPGAYIVKEGDQIKKIIIR